MVNIILPLKDEIDKAKELIKSTKNAQVVYYVGVEGENKGKIKSGKQVNVYVYKDGSKKEEMIGALAKKVGDGKIIIMRKLLTKQELDKFISSQADITICEGKKQNRFCRFFTKIWLSIVSMIFGINLFDGDASVIAFCPSMSDVLKNVPNVSYLSRVDRWKGADIESVPTQSPKAKMEYDKVKNNLMFFGWLAALLLVIAGATVYFVLCKATFLLALLWACAILLAGVGFAISTMIYTLNIKTGQRKFDTAKEE